MALKRIIKELNELEDYSEYCNAEIMNGNMFYWRATIIGPKNSLYEDGIFHLDIKIPENYPFNPPQIRFKTKIYHPNVHISGMICMDILDTKWDPIWTM